jgi:hypothetical protein
MYGITIIGAVIYLGMDPGGRQALGVFSGAPLIKDVLNKNLTNVKKIIDDLTIACK